MEKVITHSLINHNCYLGSTFMDCRSLFMTHFDRIPSIAYVGELDDGKALDAFMDMYEELIAACFHYSTYNGTGMEVKDCSILLNNECMLDFNCGCVYVLYDLGKFEFAFELVEFLTQFRIKAKRKPREMNLVIRESHGLQLKPMEVKRSKLDLDLFYEDDFKEMDMIIRKRLNRKNDKGIVLLHGLPGTGKTTYLRYLVGKIKKRVLFLSSNLAGNLIDPEFIDLLINNPNSVVIVEDSENIMMDRRNNGYSSVSTLLNISDGLLTDFLNIQLVCTFNSSLGMVDPALMRKGRMIARYEFGKLGVEKAQRLSNHFGFDKVITEPMTLAEISNPNERSEPRTEIIGFRRQNELMN